MGRDSLKGIGSCITYGLYSNDSSWKHIPPVRLILHPFSNFFELISPSGYIAVTLQEFKIINIRFTQRAPPLASRCSLKRPAKLVSDLRIKNFYSCITVIPWNQLELELHQHYITVIVSNYLRKIKRTEGSRDALMTYWKYLSNQSMQALHGQRFIKRNW